MRQRETRSSLILRATSGREAELGVAAMRAVADLRDAAPHDVGLRVAIRNAGVDSRGSHLDRLMPTRSSLDVLVDVWRMGTAQPPIDPLVEVWRATSEWACPYRSQALAGQQVRFIRGFGALSMDFLLARKPSLNHDEMIDYWTNKHTALHYPRLSGYSQLHVDATDTTDLAKAVGVRPTLLDGVAEPHYDNADHFYATAFDPSVYLQAAQDELNFLDHTGSSYSVMTNFWLATPDGDTR